MVNGSFRFFMTFLSDLSKLDTLLHETHRKILLVLSYQDSTCVDYNAPTGVGFLYGAGLRLASIRSRAQ